MDNLAQALAVLSTISTVVAMAVPKWPLSIGVLGLCFTALVLVF